MRKMKARYFVSRVNWDATTGDTIDLSERSNVTSEPIAIRHFFTRLEIQPLQVKDHLTSCLCVRNKPNDDINVFAKRSNTNFIGQKNNSIRRI